MSDAPIAKTIAVRIIGHVDDDDVRNYNSALYPPHGCEFVVLGDLDEATLTVTVPAADGHYRSQALERQALVAEARCVIADLLTDPTVVGKPRERALAFLNATEGPGGADFRRCPGVYHTESVHIRCELEPGHSRRHQAEGLRWDLSRRP